MQTPKVELIVVIRFYLYSKELMQWGTKRRKQKMEIKYMQDHGVKITTITNLNIVAVGRTRIFLSSSSGSDGKL